MMMAIKTGERNGRKKNRRKEMGKDLPKMKKKKNVFLAPECPFFYKQITLIIIKKIKTLF